MVWEEQSFWWNQFKEMVKNLVEEDESTIDDLFIK